LETACVLMRLASLFARRASLVTLGVQGLIADDQSRVLLVRHGYRPGWHFPGGGVERGERVEHALRRELLEETGIVITGPASLFGIYTNFEAFPGDHVALFRVGHWRQHYVPAPNSEIAEQKFFALDQLPETLTPGTRQRLAEAFNGAEKSKTWQP
jgi:ADP-ribose pyrophosphatase YjhB (NUDIX family)